MERKNELADAAFKLYQKWNAADREAVAARRKADIAFIAWQQAVKALDAELNPPTSSYADATVEELQARYPDQSV